MEEVKNDYSKEYDQALERITRLEKRLREAYSECERLCLDSGRSSWSAKTPQDMSIHCARLINSLGKRNSYGVSSDVPYRAIANDKIKDWRLQYKIRYLSEQLAMERVSKYG